MSSDSRSIILHSLILWWMAYSSLVPPPLPRLFMLFESAGADSLNPDHSKSLCVIPFPFAGHSFSHLPLQRSGAMWPSSGQSDAGSILRAFTCPWEEQPSRKTSGHPFSLLWVLNIAVPLAFSFVFLRIQLSVVNCGLKILNGKKKSRNKHFASFIS